jgi:hypothetical protein
MLVIIAFLLMHRNCDVPFGRPRGRAPTVGVQLNVLGQSTEKLKKESDDEK